jgi:hypothetical protein
MKRHEILKKQFSPFVWLEGRKQILDNSVHNRLTECLKGQCIYRLLCVLHIQTSKTPPEIVVVVRGEKLKISLHLRTDRQNSSVFSD